MDTLVETDNVVSLESREVHGNSSSILEEIVPEGARRMLQAALDAEVSDFAEQFNNVIDAQGRRVVVRHEHVLKCELVTGVGAVPITQPRVRDRSGQRRFTSHILPPFLRRLPSIDALIPALYLKDVSTGDFSEALAAILGPKASGLSATNVVRLKECWGGAGERGLVQARSQRQTLRLLVGRWSILQRAARERPTLRLNVHRCDRGGY